MDILEELKIKTHNCATPVWASRAAKEIERLRIFEARYNLIRAGETPVFCIEDLGRDAGSRCLFDESLDAAIDALMRPNAKVSGGGAFPPSA